jgi:hypothetical protein
MASFKETNSCLIVTIAPGKLTLPYCKIGSHEHSKARAILECLEKKIYSINQTVFANEDPVMQIRSYENEVFMIFGACYELNPITHYELVLSIVDKYVKAVEFKVKAAITKSLVFELPHIDLITCPINVISNREGICLEYEGCQIYIDPVGFAFIIRNMSELYCVIERNYNGKHYKLAIPKHWYAVLATRCDEIMAKK